MVKKAQQFAVILMCFGSATSCRDAELKSYECPEAQQLAFGVNVRCGDNVIAGTLDSTAGGASVCETDGQTDCFARGSFKAADTTNLTPSRIKEGFVVAGISGNIANEGIGQCTVDGETACYASGDFLGAQISTLPVKLVAGKSVGEVQGTGVLGDAISCSSNAQIGCITSSSYVALRSDLASTCILNNGGSLNLTSGTLEWQLIEGAQAADRHEAQATCGTLEDHFSPTRKWRLPTKNEAIRAYLDDVAKSFAAQSLLGRPGGFMVWSVESDTEKSGTEKSWGVNLVSGEAAPLVNQSQSTFEVATVCVRR